MVGGWEEDVGTKAKQAYRTRNGNQTEVAVGATANNNTVRRGIEMRQPHLASIYIGTQTVIIAQGIQM